MLLFTFVFNMYTFDKEEFILLSYT